MSKLNDINKKIEETVVNNYKKVEHTITNSYKTIEDKFVDTFLKKDGETIEDAKQRLTKQQAKINEK